MKDIISARTAWNYDNIPSFLFLPKEVAKDKKRPRKSPTDTTVPHMVTVKQLAELTELSQYFIRGLCSQGKIIHVKSGTKILINYERFLDFLNSNS